MSTQLTKCCENGQPDGRLCYECQAKAALRLAIHKTKFLPARRKCRQELDPNPWQENAVRAMEG